VRAFARTSGKTGASVAQEQRPPRFALTNPLWGRLKPKRPL
jgi:hypothetical protein